MSFEHVESRAGSYADSVTLMQVSSSVSASPGVEAALIAMATPLNLDLARDLGFAVPDATADHLLVAVRAADREALRAALEVAESALTARPAVPTGTVDTPPRTVGSADATLALISVPGEHAFIEAMDALDAGLDVMIFSDNVPLEQEVRLKSVAARRGLLVMGPDCGTAVVGGIGLGFSHSVSPGPVGIVAASGTGCQHVLCLLDAAGIGVSAALGVGGRDLSAEVGGISTLAALDALDADPATELIMVISKPPADEVVRAVREHAAGLATSVRFAFLGMGGPDLTTATEGVIRALGRSVPHWKSWPGRLRPPKAGALRGLFAGGTLCDEAMVIIADQLGEARSNVPLSPQWRAHPSDRPDGHLVIDFGDDELTAGRPHPMIDQSQRLRRLADEIADPRTAAILLDVVLGYGAHPDPAGELAPLIAASPVPVAATLIGTGTDPQGLAGQAAILQRAGAHVFTSNAQATRYACDLIRSAEGRHD